MALFSRRPKKSDALPTDVDPDEGRPGESEAVEAASVDTGDAAASVGISMSSFQGLGVAATPVQALPAEDRRPAAERVVETVPGLRDNVLLREALGRLPEKPSPSELLDLARSVLQGHLFLRVKGDARALLADGKGLPLAVANIGDKTFALAYSSGAALNASIRSDGDTATSAVGQPSIAVLRHVLETSATGLIIDPASAPARAILPRALIERMLAAIDDTLTVKTLLAAERTDGTAASIADALTRVPVWLAVNTPSEGAQPGIAQGRAADGSRFLEIYTHPLEVVAMGRDDRPAPVTSAQLAAALRQDEGLSGVIIDPRGPWIRLSRDDLAPVLALAE
ncbi:SseB family protein [Microbacterium sp. SLBN-146]|uniref:SseB family protein n=1 Tax=Microbacterium sp. SLBN-146 TaxID=2768457 RepID=UPI001152C580|nr:SseB family protein [Microbacterium sp. SLBN-146]TQJ29616.1 type III secretion system (T3SS) SseB-like protein [Microbacterium sp. SLBN-146]